MKLFVLALSLITAFEARAASLIVCRDDYSPFPNKGTQFLGVDEAIRQMNEYLTKLPSTSSVSAPTFSMRPDGRSVVCVTVNQ